MRPFAVIGNVSRDRTAYPDGRGSTRLGGAALLLALASHGAGRPTTPVCVVGDDLAAIPNRPGPDALDWSGLSRIPGTSTSFTMTYDDHDDLVGVTGAYGVGSALTTHALAYVDHHPESAYHVCCRRPLDAGALLGRLADHGAQFSVDFFLPSAGELIPAVRHWLRQASTVFVNAAEYGLLWAVIDTSGLPEVVITDGSRTTEVHRFGRCVARALPPRTASYEVTGAGDTLAGVYLAHRSFGTPRQQALRLAAAAAARHVAAPLSAALQLSPGMETR